jgi:hypothetical protein
MVYGVYTTNSEKYLSRHQDSAPREAHWEQGDTHRKKVCVVALLQLRLTSSVVVTFVQVMHRDTSCLARRASVSLRVQRLLKRVHMLDANVAGDLYDIGGRWYASCAPSSVAAGAWIVCQLTMISVKTGRASDGVDAQGSP